MHLIATGWLFVTLLMALAEATSPQGTVLGAVFTFLLYGVLPLSIVLYIVATPARRAVRRRAEAAARAAAVDASQAPDGRRHAAGDAAAPVREEP